MARLFFFFFIFICFWFFFKVVTIFSVQRSGSIIHGHTPMFYHHFVRLSHCLFHGKLAVLTQAHENVVDCLSPGMGRSFHSLSWLIGDGRIDVYSCLTPPFCAWFCVGPGLLSSQYILGFCFVIATPVKPESFQWKQSVLQPCILPLALRGLSVCIESEESGGREQSRVSGE